MWVVPPRYPRAAPWSAARRAQDLLDGVAAGPGRGRGGGGGYDGGATLANVADAVERGCTDGMDCRRCAARGAPHVRGATMGCHHPKCRHTYHFHCGKKAGGQLVVARGARVPVVRGGEQVDARIGTKRAFLCKQHRFASLNVLAHVAGSSTGAVYLRNMRDCMSALERNDVRPLKFD